MRTAEPSSFASPAAGDAKQVVTVRVAHELHTAAQAAAQVTGQSLNSFCVTAIQKAINDVQASEYSALIPPRVFTTAVARKLLRLIDVPQEDIPDYWELRRWVEHRIEQAKCGDPASAARAMAERGFSSLQWAKDVIIAAPCGDRSEAAYWLFKLSQDVPRHWVEAVIARDVAGPSAARFASDMIAEGSDRDWAEQIIAQATQGDIPQVLSTMVKKHGSSPDWAEEHLHKWRTKQKARAKQAKDG